MSTDQSGPRMSDEFLTVAEVAGILRVNLQTVRNWIAAGSLPALRIGRRVRIIRRDLEAFTDRGRTGPKAQPSGGAGAGQRFWAGELDPG